MKGKIAIFCDHPRVSIHGVNGLMNVLGGDYQFKIFTRHEIPHKDRSEEHTSELQSH